MASEAPKPKGQFFLVWSPQGPTEPRTRHQTHKSALHEAWRMAKLFPGQRFFVLKSASKPCFHVEAPVEQAPIEQAA